LVHSCPLVMYEDLDSEPLRLLDSLDPTDDPAYLEAYKYKKLKKDENVITRILYEHKLTYNGLSYNKQTE